MKTPPSAIIALDSLTKYYGRTLGIRSISLTVERGEIFGFLGPNGSGKTTTIRLLLDLLKASSGRALLFGLPVPENSIQIRRKCGYLPGSFAAYGQMSGSEYLHFVAELRAAPPVAQPELLDRFRLSPREMSDKMKHLSHGTLQKLGIVQAFSHRPELLILDEPTLGLDPLMQEEFYELLREVQRRGSTVFLSSHNLPEVEKVCHRAAVIRDGELVTVETLESLKKKRFRKLRLRLRSPAADIELSGAELLKQQGLEYEFLIKGDMAAVITDLARLPVEDIVLPEPDLEEVFMAYYRSEKDA